MYLGTAFEFALGLVDAAEGPLADPGNGELERDRLMRPALFGIRAEVDPMVDIIIPKDDGGGGE